MVVRTNEYKSFPKKGANLYEGTLTRYTSSVSPTGGVNDGAAVYSAPIAKGDLVVLYQHTVNGEIQVQKAAAGVDVVHGIVIDEPQGIDNATTSSGTPTHVYQRKATIAWFAIGIIELLVSSTGAVEPGDIVGLDADEANQVETQIAHDGAITVATNGGFVALSYGTDGQYLPVLVGTSLFIGN